MTSLQRLEKVYRENDYPKATRLLKLARQQPGLEDIKKKEVDQFLAQQTSKQVLRKTPPLKDKGSFVATRKNEKWYGDLIDSTSRPDGEFRYILVIIDLFTRKLYLENLEQKTVDSVTEAYNKIVKRAG